MQIYTKFLKKKNISGDKNCQIAHFPLFLPPKHQNAWNTA